MIAACRFPTCQAVFVADMSQTQLVTVFIPITLVLIAVIMVAALYNSLAVARVRMKNAFSQIDVQLRRRYDLVPTLVETTRGYMAHERATLQAVTQARQAAQQAMDGVSTRTLRGVHGLASATAVLDGALRGLLARVEAYPELKANSTMQVLQEELITTENRVAFARQAFNDAVMGLNERVVSFPGNVVAGIFGFEQGELWQTEAETRVVPSASLREPV